MTPNDHGRSYVIYTEEFNDHGQADGAVQYIQYAYGYVDLNQTTAFCVSTEQEFFEAWSVMEPGEGDKEIDEVRIITHGNYYALIIDNGLDENDQLVREPQNLTVSPDGRVTSDSSCMLISDLPEKSIYRINIYSCNTGLLDAINIEYDKEYDENNHYTFHITGNVAQAFLYNQDVQAVYAWDGSVTPLANGFARLSNNQIHYYGYLKETELNRVVEPSRNNFSDGWFWRRFISHDNDDIHNNPIGKILYMDLSFKYICSYDYSEKQSDGNMIIHHVTVDLLTGEMEDTIKG